MGAARGRRGGAGRRGRIALGLDTGCSASLSAGTTSALEQALVDKIAHEAPGAADPAPASLAPGLMLAVAATGSPSRPRPRCPARRRHVPPLAGATEWINSPPLTPRACAARWCWSTSGPTRASTACARCPTFAPGPRSTRTRAWWWSACTRRSSPSRSCRPTCEAPPRTWASASRWRWTATTPSGAPSATSRGRRFYFIDAQGRIRHHQFGENMYDKAEQVIQQLLAEAGRRRRAASLVRPKARARRQRPTHCPRCRARPTWAMSARTTLPRRAASRATVPASYQSPPSLRTNQWALAGEWTVEGERAVLAPRWRTHRLPLPGARPAPGARAVGRRQAGALPRDGSTASRRSRTTAPTPTRRATAPSTGSGSTSWCASRRTERPAVRDRVSRRRRAGLRVHLRLSRRPAPARLRAIRASAP
jgi:hypothetical protein